MFIKRIQLLIVVIIDVALEEFNRNNLVIVWFINLFYCRVFFFGNFGMVGIDIDCSYLLW